MLAIIHFAEVVPDNPAERRYVTINATMASDRCSAILFREES
jgi:hypothetical protein